MTVSLIDAAKTRYSAKVYDPERKIPEEDIAKLKELLRLAPSSVNLQPWYFVVAGTEEGKARVAKSTEGPFSFNTPKITDASHVVVFATRVKADDDAFLTALLEKEAEDGRFDADPEQFRADMDRGRRTFVSIHAEQRKDAFAWMNAQTYLNMGQFLIAAAQLGIDATPMEGVDTEVLNKEFGLTEKGYTAVAVVSLGYHAKADFNADLPKSRLAENMIMETV